MANRIIPVKKPKKKQKKVTAAERRNESRQMLGRIFGVMIFCGILLFIPLIFTLFKLMIVDHNKYEALAISNQTRSISVSATRGVIYDRNLNLLAGSTSVETIFIDPLQISKDGEDVEFIANGLGKILGVKPQKIMELAAKTDRQYEVVAYKQPKEVADQVREFIDENDLTGIHTVTDSKRYYPYGTLASQVIGFTNSSNSGAEGLEAYYNSQLEGTAGAIVTTKGNYGTEMLYSYEKNYEASDGNSLVLTLDATVQYYLEKNLETAIEKYDVQNGGFAIMMDVNTGEIIGMATLGGYDPNNYLEILDEDTLEDLQEMKDDMKDMDEDSPEYEQAMSAYDDAVAAARLHQWRNRNVSDGYEPGSTFKTITLAAALEEGAVTLDDTFYCGGKETFWGRDQELHCWKATGHHTENTAQALQNSCNLAFAHIGLKLGGDKLYEYAKSFGLLETTDIDLPGEGSGVFHTLTQLSDYETNGTYSLIDTAFGQSFKVTPIQLVRAIAAVVNGGYVLEPYIVGEILDADGNVLQKKGRTVIRQAISEETSATMCELMESVVTEGTAGNAALAGYRIGGKTGTSEKLDENTEDKIVSFVGVAPMDNPRYVVLVALDSPSRRTGYYISGGVMAAPVVRDIFGDTLQYLGVQPDYTNVDMSTVNVEMPDVKNMDEKTASETLAAKSLVYIVVGKGETVTGQIPAAGQLLPGNSKVILYMGEEVPTDKVTVPNLMGMTPAQANAAIANSGLYLQYKGSTSSNAKVTSQSLVAGAQVARGTLITVEYTDDSARD